MWEAVLSTHLKGHFICGQEYTLHDPDKDGIIDAEFATSAG